MAEKKTKLGHKYQTWRINISDKSNVQTMHKGLQWLDHYPMPRYFSVASDHRGKMNKNRNKTTSIVVIDNKGNGDNNEAAHVVDVEAYVYHGNR